MTDSLNNGSFPFLRGLCHVQGTVFFAQVVFGRFEYVQGAFGLAAAHSVAGAHVLLIDDVTTTGATANEAARTLLAGRAEHVTLAVVAKAEPPTAYAEQLSSYRA